MINQKSNRKKLKTIAILSAITICSSIALGTVESKAGAFFSKSATSSSSSSRLSLSNLKMPKIKMPKVDLVNPFSGLWGRVKGIFTSNKGKPTSNNGVDNPAFSDSRETPRPVPSAPPLDDSNDVDLHMAMFLSALENSTNLTPTAPPAE